MKGIAIGFSDTSREILKRLKKTEFINEIYVASSSLKNLKKDHNILSITITPGSLSLEDNKELISLIEAPTEPIKIIKSNLIHFSLRIDFGFTNEILWSSFTVLRDELAIYISLINSVFFSRFKISCEVSEKPIAIPFNLKKFFYIS